MARLHRWTEFDRAQPNYVDAAVAHLLGLVPCDENVIPRHDDVPEAIRGKKLTALKAASHEHVATEFQKKEMYELLGKEVAKIGSTTGYTEGIISAALVDGITAWVPSFGNIIYHNVFEVSPVGRKEFTQPGDSGSSVFIRDERTVFGLHFAAADAVDENRNPLGYRVSYACSIQGILHEFRKYSWM